MHELELPGLPSASGGRDLPVLLRPGQGLGAQTRPRPPPCSGHAEALKTSWVFQPGEGDVLSPRPEPLIPLIGPKKRKSILVYTKLSGLVEHPSFSLLFS